MRRAIILIITIITLLFSSVVSTGCKKQEKVSQNLVLLVEFADTKSPFLEDDIRLLNGAFCGKEGLDNFIKTNSNGYHNLSSNVLGVVKIDKNIDYFMPKYKYDLETSEYKEVNSLGYDNRLYDENGNPSTSGKQSAERFYREQELLYLATKNASDLTKSLGKKPEFENLTLVPSKLNKVVAEGDLFHPHQTNNYVGDPLELSTVYHTDGVSGTIKESKIGKTAVGSYVLIPYAYICNGEYITPTTLCHEYMHVLGAPDLYKGNGANVKKPVGEFDVLGGQSTPVPTQSLSYVKYKMGWLKEGEDILPVTASGEYNLTAVEDEGGVKAYKITLASHYQNGDVFYLEYRKLGKGSMSSTPTEGVIIYRVNEENGYLSSTGEKTNIWRGNAYGDYEVIVFRNLQDLFYGNNTTICDKEGYTSFGNPDGNVNVIPHSDEDETNSKIYVEYLGVNEDGTVKIRIELPEEDIVIPKDRVGVALESGSRRTVYFDRVSKDCKAYVFVSEKSIKRPTADKLLKSKKGELISTYTKFLKTTIPQTYGFERYVYVFYQDANGYSNVYEYHIKGIKNLDLKTVLIFAVAVGIVIPTVALRLLTKSGKKKEKKDGK